MMYLDHAASTPDKTHPYTKIAIDSRWDANPHSVHDAGLRAHKVLQEAEFHIKDAINGHDGVIVWTQNGSTANSLIIRATCCSGELVGSWLEHKSITQWYGQYGDKQPEATREGFVSIHDAMNSCVMDWTRLVCLQHVNNETGVIQPVRSMSAALMGTQARLHVDAVQSFGKLPLDVQMLGCDSLAISAHKIYGPKGIGCLWISNDFYKQIKDDIPYTGTPSVELAVRFAHAVRSMRMVEHQQDVYVKESNFLWALEDAGIEFELNSKRGLSKVPGILSMYIPGVDNDELVFTLASRGVYISTGSACNKDPAPSATLMAMGLPVERVASTVRISLGDAVSQPEVLRAAALMAEAIKELVHGS